MKINELVRYKDNPIYQKAKDSFAATPHFLDKSSIRKSNLRRFTDFLTEQGFELVGKGEYGVIFEKQGYPWLFKIFHDDSPYEHYVRWALRHQDNPHVPKIKGGLLKINDSTYAIRMEKLSDILTVGGQRDQKIATLARILYNFSNISEISADDMKWISKNYPKMQEVLKGIESILQADDTFSLDLHMKNVMLRGMVPVITDPMYNVNSV